MQDLGRILRPSNELGDTGIDPLSVPPAAPDYHTAFDRGPSSGPEAWNLTQADGAIASTDFFSILSQFGHTCG